MRCFFAITFSEQTLKQMTSTIQPLKAALEGAAIKWIPKENLHLTLRFLGILHPDQIPNIIKQLSQTMQQLPPFELQCTDIHLFPNAHRPRVIALKMADSTALNELVEHLEKRPFRGHISVAQIKNNQPIQLPSIALTPITIAVNHIHLIKSDTRREGVVYHRINTIELNP